MRSTLCESEKFKGRRGKRSTTGRQANFVAVRLVDLAESETCRRQSWWKPEDLVLHTYWYCGRLNHVKLRMYVWFGRAANSFEFLVPLPYVRSTALTRGGTSNTYGRRRTDVTVFVRSVFEKFSPTVRASTTLPIQCFGLHFFSTPTTGRQRLREDLRNVVHHAVSN